MDKWLSKYFSEDDLTSIKNEISEVEKHTSGQIRVCFRHKRKLLEKKGNLHEITIKQFHSLGMHKTKHKTGVLIFILFHDRYFNILADEGIHRKIQDSLWKEFEEMLITEFKKGNYSLAIIHVIKKIGESLAKEFPAEDDDVNELADEVEII